MKTMKHIAIGVIATLFLNPVFAAATDACPTPGMLSGFSNGIQNTRLEAVESQTALMLKTPGVQHTNNLLLYHTQGRVEGDPKNPKTFRQDMLEVYSLLSKEALKGNPELEAQALAIFHGYRPPKPEPNGIIEKLKDYYERSREEALTRAMDKNTEQAVANTITRDVEFLTSALSPGDNLVLAAHSQGTLWANAALTRLQREQPLLAKQVRVAYAGAAASYIWQTPGGNPNLENAHVTNTNDLVIKALRGAAAAHSWPAPLPSNSTHSFTSEEKLGHGFIKIYLNSSEATGTTFLSHYVKAAEQLRNDNRGAPIVTFDVTLDLGPLALAEYSPTQFQLNHWYGFDYPQNGKAGLVYTHQILFTAPNIQRTIQKWYCDPVIPVPAGSKLPLYVTVAQKHGKPTLVRGGVLFNKASYEVQRLGAGEFQPLEHWNWPFASVVFENTTQGVKPKLVME